MRSSDGRLWVLAAAGSLAIHGALAASFLALPTPEREGAAETAIDIQGVRGGRAENVAAAHRLAPAEPERAVAETTSESATGAPAEIDRKTLSAAATATQAETARISRAIDAREARPPLAAAADPSAVLGAVETSSGEATRRDADRASAVAAPRTDARIVANRPASHALVPSEAGARITAVEAPITTAPAAPAPARSAGSNAAPVPAPRISAAAPAAAAAASGGVAPVRAAPDAAAAASAARPAAPAGSRPREVGSVAPAARVVASPQPGAGQARLAASPPDAGVAAAAPVSSGAAVALSAASPAAERPAPGEGGSPPSAAAAEVAVLAPRAPSRSAPPVEEIDPRERLLAFLSLHEGGSCLLALASAQDDERLAVEGFSDVPEDVARLGEELLQVTRVPVETEAHAVTRDQCGALSFARGLAGYPVPSLHVRLERRRIASGAFLSGDISNLERTMLYLLLVDDEGKVEEVENLFLGTDGAVGFKAPMTLEDGPVETAQILVALASDTPLATVASHDGAHADDYFPALADEIARTGKRVEFGFAHFFVR